MSKIRGTGISSKAASLAAVLPSVSSSSPPSTSRHTRKSPSAQKLAVKSLMSALVPARLPRKEVLPPSSPSPQVALREWGLVEVSGQSLKRAGAS